MFKLGEAWIWSVQNVPKGHGREDSDRGIGAADDCTGDEDNGVNNAFGVYP